MHQFTGQSLRTHEENVPLGETTYRLTSILLIVSVLGFFIPFTILLAVLHFTDQPASISFSLFRQQSVVILLSYYVVALSGLLLIGAVLALYRVLVERETLTMIIATVCGILGGLMQAIGDLRWPFLLSPLATLYFDPNGNQASRSTVTAIFQTVDQFAGVILSEHLYYLFIGVWSLLVGLYLLRSMRSIRWLAWLGIMSGCGLLISSIEQFDWPVIGSALLIVVVLSRVLWSVWLLSLAVILLQRRARTNSFAFIKE